MTRSSIRCALAAMAAVVGQSDPQIYAAFRGEDLETFMKSRNVAIQYSVAGGDKAKELKQ